MKKFILCLFIPFLLSSCGGAPEEKIQESQESEIVWMKVIKQPSLNVGTILGRYHKLENIDPELTKIVEGADKRYYIFADNNQELFRAWFEEIYPRLSWTADNGLEPFAYIMFFGSRYDIWIPGKRMVTNKIVVNPYLHAHEEAHYMKDKDTEGDMAAFEEWP